MRRMKVELQKSAGSRNPDHMGLCEFCHQDFILGRMQPQDPKSERILTWVD